MKDRRPRAWVRVDPLTPEDDGWRHRPLWKRAANTLLRACQRGPMKWVFYTACEVTDEGERPKATGYGFGRVEHVT